VASDVPALEVVGLTRRFGARVAVDALSIRVNPGDVYGFLGPNGAGKTTAIRCMIGLIRKDAGTVSIFGESDPVAARRHIGAMVETPAFHPWMSARDNLRRALDFHGRGDAADINWAIDRVGLKGREEEKVQTYSLGMRQRLGIARALAARPKLMILDEPTNGLDPRGMKEIRDLLDNLARTEGLTILISSHLLAEIQLLCTRVGIIDKGRMIAEGDVAELLAGKGRVEEVDVGAADVAALRAALDAEAGATIVGEGEDGRLRVALEAVGPADLNRRLVQAGVEIDAFVPVRKSLEDLFLDLTSREIT
jgi:ABC-type multidrug transport system ATPase subunit